ncbi:signal recognition particle protein [Actinomyces sp. zg-332]|uniref:signal recognition particle protein n=1 Tax=Actinomyces sp. zg-332 TaxID=2708340 RepID=UPI001424197B|nr:signal recognition particle protein [Actinomyces sp. zg-332]QPK93769.1 signal recognition particle protein [Actinomyces sp. zg-332]
MFNNLSDRLRSSFKQLRGKGVLTQADVDNTVSEIRRALLEADVALPVVRDFTSRVREKAYGATQSKALQPGQQVIKIVNEELIETLGGATRELNFKDHGVSIFMLAGLQGAGKTTLAGKLSKWMRQEGKKVLLVACDLQRPNAVTQLQVMAERAEVDIFAPEPGNGVGDPVKVARDSIKFAEENGYDLVIIDTAGRLGIDEEMMQQARDIRDVVSPDEIIFVLDAMVGQDAVNTSIAFRDGVGFTGVVLSKLDGDARGGAALSVRGVTGAPVLFASTGEGINDFERFHADRMASRILDMGDILTLIEQAEKVFDNEQAEKAANKLASGEFTLEDFLDQLAQIRKLGSMKKMLGMLPGVGKIRDQLDNFDEKEIDRIEAIVRSMTPQERADLKILNGSRRARIAKGSGTSVAEINSLVQRFEQAKTMMAAMSRGQGIPNMNGIGGMGSLPGMGKKSKGRIAPTKNKKGKNKKGKSGNPAKRAQQEKEALLKKQNITESGSAFEKPQVQPPTMDDIPDDIKRMLGRF